jgi:ubiquinone/menaquinone biosynthesis C-methylase UbiE
MSIASHLDPAIAAYYARNNEPNRLTTGVGKLEFLRTQEIVRRHLPKSPAVILDIGGAAGIHACWLARDGYEVHLIDAMTSLVEDARKASAAQSEHPIASCSVGDARHLSQADSSVDAVLMCGPLYHLIERTDRVTALREACRVLRPGGLLVAAVISRFASILDGLNRSLIDDPKFAKIIEDDLRTGIHRNPTDNLEYFTTAYFHKPEDLKSEIAEAGFAHKATLAVEGPSWQLPDLDARLDDPTRRQQLLRSIRSVESERTLTGASAHLLGVAAKPA